MKFVETDLPGVVLVEPPVYRDPRGYFLETHHAEKAAAAGLPDRFVQDNQSRSRPGVLRGLHAQHRHPQGKLVRAVAGEIFDVAVDIRPGSGTFGRWVGFTLSGDNFRQLYVPPGFLHGFCVTGDTDAVVTYKCTALYAPGDEMGVVWNDPAIGIEWPVEEPVLSEKDAALPLLAELDLG